MKNWTILSESSFPVKFLLFPIQKLCNSNFLQQFFYNFLFYLQFFSNCLLELNPPTLRNVTTRDSDFLFFFTIFHADFRILVVVHFKTTFFRVQFAFLTSSFFFRTHNGISWIFNEPTNSELTSNDKKCRTRENRVSRVSFSPNVLLLVLSWLLSLYRSERSTFICFQLYIDAVSSRADSFTDAVTRSAILLRTERSSSVVNNPMAWQITLLSARSGWLHIVIKPITTRIRKKMHLYPHFLTRRASDKKKVWLQLVHKIFFGEVVALARCQFSI